MAEIFNEIDEDIRRERYLKLWKTYGKYLIISIVLFLVGVSAYIAWKNYDQNKRRTEGKKFEKSVELVRSNNITQGILSFEKLANSSSSGYHTLALFHQAGSYLKSGDSKKAIDIYRKLVTDSKADRILQDLAALYLVTLRFDDASDEEISQLLSPLLIAGNPWNSSALELEGFRLIKKGKLLDAKNIFKKLSEDLKAPVGIRSRSSEILLILEKSK